MEPLPIGESEPFDKEIQRLRKEQESLLVRCEIVRKTILSLENSKALQSVEKIENRTEMYQEFIELAATLSYDNGAFSRAVIADWAKKYNMPLVLNGWRLDGTNSPGFSIVMPKGKVIDDEFISKVYWLGRMIRDLDNSKSAVLSFRGIDSYATLYFEISGENARFKASIGRSNEFMTLREILRSVNKQY